MPYIGRAPTASITKLEDADQDTKIQVEESSDEDIIRFDIAGAEDFTMTANTFTAAASSIVALDDGAVGTPALTNTGDLNTGVYFPAADTVGVVSGGTEQFRFGSNPIPGGSKNLIQNGSMTVNQRGTTTAQGDGGKATDRWVMSFFAGTEEARYTLSQDSSAPVGFSYSYKVDCTTAESAVAAGEALVLQQMIEAQNLQHLAYGNAAAKTCTLSFWVKSPKTGQHGVSIYVPDGSRGIHSTYTIASADTWEYFTWTFAGDTSGTINNDTGIGFNVRFCLYSGSTYDSDTLDTWSGSQFVAGTSQVNTMDNTANNFYLTGVQLEVGSVATDFAHEDYGTTLNKCKRYYQIILAGPNVRSSPYTGDPAEMIYQVSGTAGEQMIRLQPEMRAIPTSQLSSAAHIGVEVGDIGSKTSTTCTSAAFESGYVYTGQLWTRVGWSGSTGDKGDMARAFVQDSDCLWALSAEL